MFNKFSQFSLHSDRRTPLSSAQPEILPTYHAPARSTDCLPYRIFFFTVLIGLFVLGLTAGVVFCIILPASEVAINTLATRSLISQAAFPNASAYLAPRINASHYGLEEILKRNGTRHAIKVNLTSVEDSAEGKDGKQILCERDEECPPTLHQESNGNDDEGRYPQNQQSDPIGRQHCHNVYIYKDKINHTVCIYPSPRKEYDFDDRKWRPDWRSIHNKRRDSDFELSEVGNSTSPKDFLKYLVPQIKRQQEKKEKENEGKEKKDNGRERRQLVVPYMKDMDKDGDGIPEGLLPIKPDGASQ